MQIHTYPNAKWNGTDTSLIEPSGVMKITGNTLQRTPRTLFTPSKVWGVYSNLQNQYITVNCVHDYGQSTAPERYYNRALVTMIIQNIRLTGYDRILHQISGKCKLKVE